MKKILAIVLVAAFAACNQPAKDKAVATADTAMNEATKPAEMAEDTSALQAIAGKFPDPVCGMPYDTMFHETSVYKKDTLHFCSPTCKRVFEKNPEKYAAKLGL